MLSDRSIQPDAEEIILGSSKKSACETYLFEPSGGEERLGWLFAAVETEAGEGVGSELIETVVTAVQKEYYRESTRAAGPSFEMALHQVNLILHDMAEQGMREWMLHFHAVIAALARSELHISVAGAAQALLVRRGTVTDISTGLAHVPITNPLQTFSQVATGIVTARDTLLLASAPLTDLLAETDIARASLEQSAEHIANRLRQRYTDTRKTDGLACVAVAMLPQYVAPTGALSASRTSRLVNPTNLLPRQPLVVHRSFWQRVFFTVAQAAGATARVIKERIWPLLKSGSRRGGRAIVQASRVTGKNIQQLADRRKTVSLPNVRQFPRTIGQQYARLPKSSRLFAIICLVLLIALAGSLLLLQHKRAADTQIQQASEILQEARTKTETAKTALIYNNREQSQKFLNEAKQAAEGLIAKQLYVDEAHKLIADIDQQFDRLQRISRVQSASTRTIGDFSQLIPEAPRRLFFLDTKLYTYNPQNNAIAAMSLDGKIATVHQTTAGVGFFSDGVVHPADKTITFTTDPPGVATFDAKDATLVGQPIDFPTSKPVIAGMALFGNRLYLLDTSAHNIFAYNKSLRGYSSGSPWITDNSFPKDSITSFGVDGNVFTLHQDGSLHRLFKGQAADFTAEKVEPPLPNTARLLVSDDLKNMYVVDSAGKRVVIYTKDGKLVRQVLVEFAQQFSDAAISPQEDHIYVLDGTRVLEVSLAE